jgi:hypothetical protein
MTLNKKQLRDSIARAAEQAANQGGYLERLENIAIAIADRETVMAVYSLKQLVEYCGSRPTGMDGMLYDISSRILVRCEKDWKFTKDQLNRLWFGVSYDARNTFKLVYPYKNETKSGVS